MKQVKQIIPADGWRACYEESNGEILVEPVCCWAIVEEDGDSFIVGMDADNPVEPCSDASNFVGYIGPGESVDKYKEKA